MYSVVVAITVMYSNISVRKVSFNAFKKSVMDIFLKSNKN